MKEIADRPGFRPGMVIVGEAPDDLKLDTRLCKMLADERARLGRPLRMEESVAIIERRAALN